MLKLVCALSLLYATLPRVLTWEDAYYNNHFKNDSEGKDFVEVPDASHDGHLAHDPLGLAVAKMSYHVYSFGEG